MDIKDFLDNNGIDIFETEAECYLDELIKDDFDEVEDILEEEDEFIVNETKFMLGQLNQWKYGCKSIGCAGIPLTPHKYCYYCQKKLSGLISNLKAYTLTQEDLDHD